MIRGLGFRVLGFKVYLSGIGFEIRRVSMYQYRV